MHRNKPTTRRLPTPVTIPLVACVLAAMTVVAADEPRPAPTREYETVSLRGQVRWTADALEEQFGIRSTSDARERSLALVADDGRIYPLVEDAPGRAFRKDERLRECDVELLVRYFPAAGMIQVVRTHFVKPEGKFLVDYWCDVCSISMTELGDCSCCQQPNRLRERLVQETSADVEAD